LTSASATTRPEGSSQTEGPAARAYSRNVARLRHRLGDHDALYAATEAAAQAGFHDHVAGPARLDRQYGTFGWRVPNSSASRKEEEPLHRRIHHSDKIGSHRASTSSRSSGVGSGVFEPDRLAITFGQEFAGSEHGVYEIEKARLEVG
jgi:hypothetical protein